MTQSRGCYEAGPAYDVNLIPPTNMAVLALGNQKVLWQFDDNMTDETSYVLQKSTNGTSWSDLDETSSFLGTGRRIWFSSVGASGQHYFRVMAKQGMTLSTPSNEAAVIVTTAAAYDTILENYSNVRGLNYVATYPSLDAAPPSLPGGLIYNDVCSAVGMWRFYVHEDVETQLDMIVGLGANSIRVFLSYYAWKDGEDNPGMNGNQFMYDLDRFMDACDERGLHVMVVFWDQASTVLPGHTPSGDPFDDIDIWTMSPGFSLTLDTTWYDSTGHLFVEDVVALLAVKAATWIYDAFNEPLDFFQHAFIAATLATIKDEDPDHPTMVGYAGVRSTYVSISDANLDIIGVHPYGTFYEVIASSLKFVREVAETVGKPFFASEGGTPGYLQPYKTFIEWMYLEGVGFMNFQSHIGRPRGGHTFKEASGYFFSDGEVRDIIDAQSFQVLAVLQGIDVSRLSPMRQKLATHELWVPTAPVPGGYNLNSFLAQAKPEHWPRRAIASNLRALQGEREILLSISEFGLRQLSDAGLFLTTEDTASFSYWKTFFDSIDPLTRGAVVYLANGQLDWPRYHQFFTSWGAALYAIINARGLGVAPSGPVFLTAIATDTDEITLFWIDTSGKESKFAIFESTDNVTFTQIGTADANAQTFVRGSLLSLQRYYKISAYDGYGNSALSNVASPKGFEVA